MADMQVQDVWDNATGNANSLTSDALQAIAQLDSYVNAIQLNFDSFIPEAPQFNASQEARFLRALASAATPTSPTFESYDGIVVPDRPVFSPFTTPNIENIPAFTAAEPVLNLPSSPDTTLPSAPGAAPEFAAPALPTKPTISLPSAPTFTPVALPVPEAIEIPLFDAVADFGDVTAPTNTFEWHETEYTSAALDTLKSKIIYDLLNGGYGIDDEDERRLWDRARERELANAASKLAEVSRLHASRGFMAPPGAFIAQMDSAQQDMLEKNSSLSRDIMSKKADLYVENRKFTMSVAKDMEDMLIRHAGSVAERALNAARAQVEFGVAIFNAQVAKYNAKLEAYRAYAAAFESRVRAALAATEVFKSKVEGAKLSVETQKMYAEVYATQLEGAKTYADLYRTEMEAAQIAANIENVKLQAFRAQVETYAERVKAKVAEFDMFESRIKGEMAKVQVYEANARAYTSRLAGIEAQARVADTRARTEIAQAQSSIGIYQADIEAFKSKIGVVSEKIKSAIDKYRGQLEAYNTQVGAYNTAANLQVSSEQAQAQVYVSNAVMVGQRLQATISEYLKAVEIVSDKYAKSAELTGQIAGNWINSVSGITTSIQSTA